MGMTLSRGVPARNEPVALLSRGTAAYGQRFGEPILATPARARRRAISRRDAPRVLRDVTCSPSSARADFKQAARTAAISYFRPYVGITRAPVLLLRASSDKAAEPIPKHPSILVPLDGSRLSE